MSDIVQAKYTGSTPGANANDYTLFDSTVAFPGGRTHTMAGLNKLALSLMNDQAGTLKFYQQDSRNGTWVLISSVSVAAASANTDQVFEYIIEPYEDFRLLWTNGGSAQTTWRVKLALVGERAPAA